MGTTGARAVAAAAVVATLAGCGSSTPYTPPTIVPAGPSTVPVTQVCPERNGNAGAPQSIQGMRISAVVLCDTGDRTTSAYVERRYTTGIEAVVAALGKPDEERGAGEVFCGGEGLIYPQILVITADGRRVVPHLPVDACDSEEAVVSEIWALSQTPPDRTLVIDPADTVREDAERAQLAAKSGCPVEIADALPAIVASGARAPMPDLPSGAIIVCLMVADRDSGAPRLRMMLGGGGGPASTDRLRRSLALVDVSGTCPDPLRDDLVDAYFVDGQPLLFFKGVEECAQVWSTDGYIGTVRGTDVVDFT